jgi:hypothetical protein
MRQLHHGLLLRPSRPAAANFAEEAHQPNRDGQKAKDEPKWEYAGFNFGVGNNPPAEADYPDRDQIGQCSIHSAPFRVNCALSGTVDR